ncbi:hypothetical protein J437_LFUL017939 [Ladona fulva]|uniref:THAP-type domain-containing protein n=1 Tax=Ladona fulva TaxID=123851 RepID=A0A8K0K534_LADFU|nr:hypothetical protein J437_LFUL017939 [Ladona fulva]
MRNSSVCLVEGCYSTTSTKGLRLFHFPRNREKCVQWVEFTGSLILFDYWKKRQLLGKKIGNHCKICALHFLDEDFENEWKVRLKRGAVPSQYGPPVMEFMATHEIADVSCTTPISSNCRSTESPSEDRTFDIESSDLDDDQPPVGASKSPEKVVPTQLEGDAMRIACKTAAYFSQMYCTVEGCFANSKSDGLKLFNFPSDKNRCAKWVEFTGSWTLLEYWEKRQLLGKKIGNHCKICSLHFCDEDFENELKERLRRGVVPSRNGPPKMEFMATPEIADVS